MPNKNRLKLPPEQIYILYKYISENKHILKLLSKADAAKTIRRDLQFYIGTYSVTRALKYFNVKKDLNYNNDNPIPMIIKHLAILYKENLFPIPEELRKLLP